MERERPLLPARALGAGRLLLALLFVLAWVPGVRAQGTIESTSMATGGPRPIHVDPARPAASWLAGGRVDRIVPVPQAGLADPADRRLGWFAYGFEVPRTGWWRVMFEGPKGVGPLRFAVDVPEPPGPIVGPARPGEWAFLAKGPHRLIATAVHWTGLPQITAIRLEPARPGGPLPFRLAGPRTRPVTALGACEPARIEAGGAGIGGRLTLVFERAGTRIGTAVLDVPVSVQPVVREVPVPCDAPGDARMIVTARGADGAILRTEDRYTAFDTAPGRSRLIPGPLAVEIDPVDRPPEFGSDETQVRRRGGLAYREGGVRGTTAFARGRTGAPPSWFAYAVTGLTPGRPYVMDVEYPDDATRVMVASFQNQMQRSYPVSVAMETGGVWPLSGGTARRSAVIWPTGAEGRLLVYTVHDGLPAAISRIRFHEARTVSDPLPPDPALHRRFVSWYEEGDNFRSLVSLDTEPGSTYAPVLRYAELAASMGANVLAPTVVIYGAQMYPSRFHLTFQEPGRDLTAGFLLAAQRFGMQVFPELHPRADELAWAPRTPQALSARLLLSRDGADHYDRDGKTRFVPPFYNPLDPDVRKWYLDAVDELAERYAAYPAFAGIQLRVSHWQNPALNNFPSLEWGYNASIVRRFLSETGVTLPGVDLAPDDPAAARARHDALTAHHRDAWLRWRCEQVTAIHKELAARLRRARPDLTLQVFLFTADEGPVTDTARLREMGLDLDALKAIEGLVLVDGREPHGAREAAIAWQEETRQRHLRAGLVEALATTHMPAATLQPMHYIEIPGTTVSSEQLGWPAEATRPRWTSSASEPPGRLRLARFAEMLAAHDVTMLGDGGNGYVFSGDGLHDFAAEFTALPARPFAHLAGGPQTLVLRASGDLFYVVNGSGTAATARVMLPGAGWVERVVSGMRIPLLEGGVTLTLDPYALQVFRTDRPLPGLALRGEGP